MAEYAFCEPSTASGHGYWHIRRLGTAGPKLGGGIDTGSLCGRVQPRGVPYPAAKFKPTDPRLKLSGVGGWDLNVQITEHHLNHACPKCVEQYRRETAK